MEQVYMYDYIHCNVYTVYSVCVHVRSIHIDFLIACDFILIYKNYIK